MDCKELTLKIEAYFLDELPEKEREQMDSHFASCPSCREKLEESAVAVHMLRDMPADLPDPTGREAFVSFLERNHHIALNPRREKWPVWGRITLVGAVASVAFFILGYFSGREFSRDRVREEQIVALQQEIRETKNLMILSMLQQSSASKRIMAVNFVEELDILEPELTDALFFSLNHDKSENVRLAALEILSRCAGIPEIRDELVKSFELQTDPVIQVSMIHIMVNLKEKSSVPILEKLANDENNYESVKSQARQGLKLLL